MRTSLSLQFVSLCFLRNRCCGLLCFTKKQRGTSWDTNVITKPSNTLLLHKGGLNSEASVRLSSLMWAQLRDLVKELSSPSKKWGQFGNFFFSFQFYKPIRIFMTVDEEELASLTWRGCQGGYRKPGVMGRGAGKKGVIPTKTVDWIQVSKKTENN